MIELNTGVLDDKNEGAILNIALHKRGPPTVTTDIGKLNTSPTLMLLYLGFFFTFQTLWIIASTMLHRLVVMELGYRQLMSNQDSI